ncbi:MAG: FecR domain-containing protein [Sedimentisphaerales bacterium]|nr:FecR domain-containing protein [Sedimentisphaerales bacterium]
MTEKDINHLELSELILRVQEQSATDEEIMRLEQTLQDDPEALAFYVHFTITQTGIKYSKLVTDANHDENPLKDIVERDLAQLALRTQMSSACNVETIKQLAEERLNRYLAQSQIPHLQTGNRFSWRGYIAEQKARFYRSIKILAACLIISLIGYFVFDRFIDATPRLQYAVNTYVVRGERTLPAADIRKLKTGDIVRTGPGGNAVIQYRTEKTSLQLDENTHFAILSQEKGKQFELVQGQIDALVAPQVKNQPLIIESEYGRSLVLGTNFQLIANPLGACLAVRTGCVQLTRREDGCSIDVDSGKYALAAEGVAFETRPYSDGMDLSRNFWHRQPYATGSRSIAMEAIAAPGYASVEYYFECITGNGHDSGWLQTPFYEDQKLQPDTEYSYRLKVRKAQIGFVDSALSFAAVARTTLAITLEAESGELTDILEIGEDPAASGGKYIYTKDKNVLYRPAENRPHKATYAVQIEKAGYYRIRGWCYTPNLFQNSNSFQVTVDGQPEEGYIWDILPNVQYDWDYVNDRDNIDPVELRLEKGEHQIIFYVREDGTRLDRFELEYQPNQ